MLPRSGCRGRTRSVGLVSPRGGWILLLGLMACQGLGPAAPLPADARAMSMPPQYREWWSRTEHCSGETGALGRIEWFLVPGVSTFMAEGRERVALWTHSSAGMRIVIAGAYAADELIVRHEMLHALLDQENHPAMYFVTRCRLTWATWDPEAAH